MSGPVHQLRRRLAKLLLPLVALSLALTPASTALGGHIIPAIGVHPHYVYAGRAMSVPAAATFTCQQPAAAVHCYGPDQIRAAYAVQAALDRGIAGWGRTIVIIDAFQSPTIRQDLQTFDTAFGIPPAVLNIVAPDGLTPFDPNNTTMVGWSGEISLDVEWAHAVAPAAMITLVLARSDQDADILSATRYAVRQRLGDVVSQSFGEGEACMSPALMTRQHQVFAEAVAQGMTLFASSGDSGAGQPDCNGDGRLFKSVSTPASDPLVGGVGGTNLNANLLTGAYRSERAWGDGFGESGGGYSAVYARPSWQDGLRGSGKMRGVPDLAYDAGVDGGVLTAWGGNGSFYIFGGTSAGSPQWAGITALADQAAARRLGTLNPSLYQLARSGAYGRALHDVTSGNNVEPGIGGYSAGPGWDPVTGLGSPNASALLTWLAAA